MTARAAAVLAMLLATAGCNTVADALTGDPLTPPARRPSPDKIAINGQTDFTGTDARVTDQTFLVARTQREWQDIWRLIGKPAPAPLPAGLMAVAIWSGRRNGSDYGVSVVSVLADQAIGRPMDLVVTYREATPPIHAPASPVQTSPYVVHIMPLYTNEVRFVPEG